MFHLYISRLKCLFRTKVNIFWNYMFPILLCTCFYFAFKNLWNSEEFKTIPIAYVNQQESTNMSEDPLKEALKLPEFSKGKPVFFIKYCTKEEARKLLKKSKIEAYIVGSTEPALFIKDNGIDETIVKSFLDSYRRTAATVKNIQKVNPQVMNAAFMKDIVKFKSYTKEAGSKKKPDVILIYFYSLMAYTCLFAANWSVDEVNNIQADQSDRGARMCIAPINKMKLFLCNMLAGFTAHLGSLILLFLYMYYAIKINFGSHLFLMFCTCLLGSLAGLMLGAAVGILVKKSAEVKQSILTLIILGGSFLSGLMMLDMKYIVATKAPLLAYINPVNLVTDALYSLYYYNTYERYALNMVLLGVFTIVCGVLSFMGIRRKNYASI